MDYTPKVPVKMGNEPEKVEPVVEEVKAEVKEPKKKKEKK